jgi:NAD-dependent deacetylase
MPFNIISSAEMLERDLREVWAWFDFRRGVLEKLEPNPAHTALAGWQKRFPDFTLVTQNIDGLHQAAGTRSVIELHGNLWRARCISCATRYDLRAMVDEERPPVCPECGNHLRPDVVLFGEQLPAGAFEMASAKAETCDLCFVMGTSAVVYPAAMLPEIAARAGAYTVEINPERTPLSDLCDETIVGKAGEVLPLFDVNRKA